MRLAIPRETTPDEPRIPMIPADVKKLTAKGAEIHVEAGMGAPLGISDDAYAEVGATVTADRAALLAEGDLVLRLRKPPLDEVASLKKGAIHVSFLDPFNEHDTIRAFQSAGVSAISMEMIPRSTIAQKMDALSSQANLAGYVAVILAAENAKSILPMMMTPSGTITPARVLIIGVGVAGLQAIATAKRLGARVEAYDTRPEVAEQIESLGAKALKIDVGDTGSTKDGYAKALTEEQLAMQREQMTKYCASADILITTAALFGRKAPVIVSAEMVAAMKPGSVIVDMAVETGGNVEGSRPGEVVDVNGVQILGMRNLPGRVAAPASQMYSANITNFVDHFWDDENKTFNLDLEDELMRCVITHDGAIHNEMIRETMEPKTGDAS